MGKKREGIDKASISLALFWEQSEEVLNYSNVF